MRLFVRVPWLLAVAVLACAPARIPVSVGSTEANLLVPLYLVVAAAALALAWQLFWDDGRARELGPLAWPLALLVGWLGLAFLWTDDLRAGRDRAALLRAAVRPARGGARAHCRGGRLDVLLLYVQLLGMALVFAAIGICQWLTRNIFWNPKVEVATPTRRALFFRVNSVFYDPSIYGRFLVVAILAALVVVLFDAAADGRIGGRVRAVGRDLGRARSSRSRSRASSR